VFSIPESAPLKAAKKKSGASSGPKVFGGTLTRPFRLRVNTPRATERSRFIP
jgi:hypothetical protein